MDVTVLGTGNPIPQLERGGTSIVLSIGSDKVLVDCGQMAVHRLVENGIDFTAIEDVFFTHHHLDHNADFYYFAQVGWFLGRDQLSVYGPKGTKQLLDGLEVAHSYNIESWRGINGYQSSDEGITDISYRETTKDLDVRNGDWHVTAMPVEHVSMVCYAYRFDELSTGSSFVYTGDTRQLSSMSEFARDADILMHNCNARGKNETPLSPEEVPWQYIRPPFDKYYETRTEETLKGTAERHSTPAEAAEIATEAGVETLLLTHFDHFRDPATIQEEAESVFDGEVYVCHDGLSLTSS